MLKKKKRCRGAPERSDSGVCEGTRAGRRSTRARTRPSPWRQRIWLRCWGSRRGVRPRTRRAKPGPRGLQNDHACGAKTIASAQTVSVSPSTAETQALLQEAPKAYQTQINDIWLTALVHAFLFFFSSRRRHTRFDCDWSSDVCSSDLFSAGRLRADFRRFELQRADAQRKSARGFASGWSDQRLQPARRGRSGAGAGSFKIGRASCRERV